MTHFFKLTFIGCCIALCSCHSSRSVSSYDCEFDTVNAEPVSKRQLPKAVMADLNAWGNTGWLLDEAQVVDQGNYEVYQLRLRNRTAQKSVCYQVEKEPSDE